MTTDFTKKVQEKLNAKFKDPYTKASDDELNKIYEEVNEEEALKDIDNYFTDDEQIELASNGITLVIGKVYNVETGKKPIWNGKITNIFKKWLKTRYPDDFEFIEQEESIKEAIEEVKNGETEKKFLTSKDIKKKLKENRQKTEENNENNPSNDDFDIFEEEDTLPITTQQDEKSEPEESKFEIVVQDKDKALPIRKFNLKVYPSEQEIEFLIKRHKFVKDTLLDKNNDIITIKKSKFIKKSGWRKFINAFGISIELIEQKVYEQFGDKHAEIRVRAITPNGQSVEGIGIKSWSELYDKNMHNLIANAWTRAVNRAVSDLVGYGAVSYEELNEKKEESDFF